MSYKIVSLGTKIRSGNNYSFKRTMEYFKLLIEIFLTIISLYGMILSESCKYFPISGLYCPFFFGALRVKDDNFTAIKDSYRKSQKGKDNA